MQDDRTNCSGSGKLAYEKPQLTRIGSLEDVTRNASSGHALDKDFARGSTDLTFSDFPT